MNLHQELSEFLGGFGTQPGGSGEKETFEHLNQGGTEGKMTEVTVRTRHTYPAGSAKVRSVHLNEVFIIFFVQVLSPPPRINIVQVSAFNPLGFLLGLTLTPLADSAPICPGLTPPSGSVGSLQLARED